MVKKFNLNLKEPHLEIINDLKENFSITSNKEMVSKCIKSAALNLNKDDLIFSTIKEKCSGGCFASEPQFEIEMNEDIFSAKKIYTKNDFNDYKTEEEEVIKYKVYY